MNGVCTISKNRNTGTTRNTRKRPGKLGIIHEKGKKTMPLSIKNKCSFSLFYIFAVFLVADLYSRFLYMRLNNYCLT